MKTRLRKTFSAALMIAVLMLSSSCALLGGGSDDRVSEQLLIHKGTQGLVMAFSQSAPPDKLYAAEEGMNVSFPVVISMANQGAYDIKGGYIAMSLESNYLKLNRWKLEDSAFQLGARGERIIFNLEGRKATQSLGSSAVATAFINSLPLDRLTEQHTTTIIATACYEYRTQASAEVCIDTDPYNLKATEKPCTPQTLNLAGGQGAPIEVTKVEQTSLMADDGSIRPQFLIHVKNSGRGVPVIHGKADEACSSEALGKDDINVLDITEISFSQYSLKKGQILCNPDKLKLKNNEGYFKCTLEPKIMTNDLPAFSTALYVQLDYAYSETISKNVLLERILSH
jgi:hypothetical protein